MWRGPGIKQSVKAKPPFIIGGIIPLVPGVALTTGIRDLFSGDYLSGSIRMIDALLTGMCIAIGVGGAIKIFQLLWGGTLAL